MASSEYIELQNRIKILKRRFLPQLKQTGVYTGPQQDFMRALRMLVHAEIESYLESMAKVLADDLEITIANASGRVRSTRLVWARRALGEARAAHGCNNGVKREDIRKMFAPLGIDEAALETISTLFLDRMSTFGKHRGDVAHQSAARASYALSRQREEKFIDELVVFLGLFDKFLIRHRLVNSL
jgi:hypothetical protein